jgi:D-alanine-D-alanine ligase
MAVLFIVTELATRGSRDRSRKFQKAAYIAVRGSGYARVDVRMDRANGELFVLEVNANCGLSEDDQTSTGGILKLAGMALAELLRSILKDASR